MAITNITGNNNQSGGQTVTPLNWGLFNRQMYSGNTKGLEVTQTTTPSMAVSVAAGLALLDYQTISSVQATILTPKTVAISTANTSNPRIDTVIIYEDTSVTMPTSEPFSADAGNGRFKLRTIDGTPAASPVALSDAAIQSTIGAGMAWTRLADVRVNANVTSIINSNITSRHNELTAKLANNSVTSDKVAWATSEVGILHFADPPEGQRFGSSGSHQINYDAVSTPSSSNITRVGNAIRIATAGYYNVTANLRIIDVPVPVVHQLQISTNNGNSWKNLLLWTPSNLSQPDSEVRNIPSLNTTIELPAGARIRHHLHITNSPTRIGGTGPFAKYQTSVAVSKVAV